MVLRGMAFCPGHITGFFSIHYSEKGSEQTGSRGAGVNVNLGAYTSVALAPPKDKSVDELELRLDVKGIGDLRVEGSIYRMVLEDLLPKNGAGWKAEVRTRLQLPAGQGFGMSAAGSLSTAIAVWEAVYSEMMAWDRKLRFRAQQERFFAMRTKKFTPVLVKRKLISPVQMLLEKDEKVKAVRSSGKASGLMGSGGVVREAVRWLDQSQADEDTGMITYGDCIKAAHEADVKNGGGLGDVVAQARGGIEMRLAPGVPPFGEVHTIPVDVESPPSVVMAVVGGPIETKTVIRDPARRGRINGAGENALSRLVKDPTITTLLNESSEFSRASGLQSMTVRGALSEIEALRRGSQIMIGNSVFTLLPKGALEVKRKVSDIWKKRGTVYQAEVDHLGARPIT